MLMKTATPPSPKQTPRVAGEVKQILEQLIARSQCEYVFTSLRDPRKPLGGWVLEDQMGRLRGQIQPHADAGLHALRHTFLTEAGEGDQAKPRRRLPPRVLEGRTEVDVLR